jgi:hypothetical protein
MFIVNQFIDQLLGQHYAESAGPKTTVLSNSHMIEKVLRRTAHSCMALSEDKGVGYAHRNAEAIRLK